MGYEVEQIFRQYWAGVVVIPVLTCNEMSRRHTIFRHDLPGGWRGRLARGMSRGMNWRSPELMRVRFS